MRKQRKGEKMFDPIIYYIPYDELRKHYFGNPTVSDWVTPQTEPVDETIMKLVQNTNFISYVQDTSRKILNNLSEYEDISKKYRY